MGKHYFVKLEIDEFAFDTPVEAVQDVAYWLLEEGGAARAVYEVMDMDTKETFTVDLEEIGYDGGWNV